MISGAREQDQRVRRLLEQQAIAGLGRIKPLANRKLASEMLAIPQIAVRVRSGRGMGGGASK